LGVNRIMTYIDGNGERVSTESAYLPKEVLSRPNLVVTLYATATKIIFEERDGSKHAVGVEFARRTGNPRYVARARKQVILTAGAVHSPHLLLLSGIGPADQLSSHSIPVVRDLPGVGSSLIDHPVVDLYFYDKLSLSAKYLVPHTLEDRWQFTRELLKYMLWKTGTFKTNFGESAAFVRTDDPELFPEESKAVKLKDSTSAGDSPDVEIFTTPMAYKEHGKVGFDVHTFAIHACLLRPLSKGALVLRSSDPFEHPIINLNYLKAEEDVQRLVRGIKLCLRIVQTEPLRSHLDWNSTHPDLDHHLIHAADSELEKLVRERVETLYHPASTCRMAPEAEGGVVDSKLRVYGVKGLRVCDASIFPEIVSGHTAAACIASAEKLADEVKVELASKN